MKSHSSTKKRIKVTGQGKYRISKTSKQHLLINKSKRQKKIGRSSHGVALHKTVLHRAKKLTPYL